MYFNTLQSSRNIDLQKTPRQLQTIGSSSVFSPCPETFYDSGSSNGIQEYKRMLTCLAILDETSDILNQISQLQVNITKRLEDVTDSRISNNEDKQSENVERHLTSSEMKKQQCNKSYILMTDNDAVQNQTHFNVQSALHSSPPKEKRSLNDRLCKLFIKTKTKLHFSRSRFHS